MHVWILCKCVKKLLNIEYSTVIIKCIAYKLNTYHLR